MTASEIIPIVVLSICGCMVLLPPLAWLFFYEKIHERDMHGLRKRLLHALKAGRVAYWYETDMARYYKWGPYRVIYWWQTKSISVHWNNTCLLSGYFDLVNWVRDAKIKRHLVDLWEAQG